MAPRKPDRRALEDELRRALAARSVEAPGLEELELLHRLGEAYGCYAPRKLERANGLYEEALAILERTEGPGSFRALLVLASWHDCARVRRQKLTGVELASLDRAIENKRRWAEALLSEAEPAILRGESAQLFPGAYALLRSLGEERRSLALLHVVTPGWAPR